MKVALALLGLVALALADEPTWTKFKSGKKFDSKTEEEKSKENFLKNKQFVDELNSQQNSFEVELNEFADLDTSELKFKKGLIRPDVIPEADDAPIKLRGPVPKNFDWATKGAVTSIQNQGSVCGSCYTFSATGALEGQYFLKYGTLPKFSEQSFVDCSGDYGNNGCGGGLPQNVFDYLTTGGGGVNYQADYLYKEKKSICQSNNKRRAVISVKGYKTLIRGDETNLKNSLANIGPVSMGIDANHSSFQFYKRGVYYEPTCRNGFNDLDHAMLLTGYGETDDGEKYWIIKNSWGENWGVNGYFWLARDFNNHCGVATDCVYPVLE